MGVKKKHPKRRRPAIRRAIHSRIAQLRIGMGLSQRDLAVLLGIGETAISQWERGVSAPVGHRLPQVAQILGVSIDDLYREAA